MTEIVYIDDDAPDLNLFEIFIKNNTTGIVAKTFPTAQKGIEYLFYNHPKLIIIDYNLELTTGDQVVKTIRDISAHKFTPILIFSGLIDDNSYERCIKSGANWVIAKPTNYLDSENVLKTIIDFSINLVPKVKPIAEDKTKSFVVICFTLLVCIMQVASIFLGKKVDINIFMLLIVIIASGLGLGIGLDKFIKK